LKSISRVRHFSTGRNSKKNGRNSSKKSFQEQSSAERICNERVDKSTELEEKKQGQKTGSTQRDLFTRLEGTNMEMENDTHPG